MATADLTLGRGKFYLAAWSGSTPPSVGSLEFLGNVNPLTIQPTEETLKHQDYTEGTRSLDEEITLEEGHNGTFKADHITTKNLAMYFRGTIVGDTVRILTSLSTRYMMRFVQNNANGPNRTYTWWKVKLTPNGPLSLVGDEWQALDFKFEGLKDSDNHPGNAWGTIEGTTTT